MNKNNMINLQRSRMHSRPEPRERSFQARASTGIKSISGISLLLGILLLVVPYATGAISYYYNIANTFPIRPVYYLLAMGVAVIMMGITSARPILPPATACLLALLAIRLADAAVFQRISFSTFYNPVSPTAAAGFFTLSLWLVTGNTRVMRWGALLSGLATLLIVSVIGYYEWQNPGLYSVVAGRSAGMLENPNDAATAIMLMMALLASMELRPTIMAPVIVIGSLGIFFTLSRGGWMMLGIFIVSYLFYNFKSQRKLLISGLLLAGLLMAVLSKIVDITPGMQDDAILRRITLLTEFRSEGNSMDDTGRLELLLNSLSAIGDRPFTGYGTGASSGVYSPHNMIAGIAVDNGLFGLVLLCAGYYFLIRDSWRFKRTNFLILTPMVLATFLSHNLVDNLTYLFCWVICAARLQGDAFPLTVRREEKNFTLDAWLRPDAPLGGRSN